MIIKKTTWTFYILLFSVFTLPGYAQTIHAIICGGTNIADIGTGCQASVSLVKDALEVIESQSEMTLQTYLLVGNDFTKANIQKTIQSINPGKDDVIWFYATSHGFNYKDNISQYTFIMAHPNQPEGYDQLDKYGLSLEKEIYNELLKKNARLTIAMAEACNNVLDVSSPDRYKAMSPVVKRNIKALFRDYSGSIIACSSERGQYSFTDLDKGGFYTNMFMEALNDVVVASEEASWEHLFDLTRKKTQGYADVRGEKQAPIDNFKDTSIKLPPRPKKEATYFKSNLQKN